MVGKILVGYLVFLNIKFSMRSLVVIANLSRLLILNPSRYLSSDMNCNL